MEIIHLVLGKVNPQRMNGVNKVVYELATRQHAAGRLVQVWGITANPVHDYPHRNFTTRLFRTGGHPFAVDAALKKALQQLPVNTVVHLHGGFIPVFAAIARLLEKYNIPFVLTPHGSYNTVALKKGYWKKIWYLPLVERRLLRKVHTVHSLGQSEVRGLHQLMPGKQSALIPYGFDAQYLDAIYEERISQAEVQPQMICSFCGRIDIHTKGLDVVAEAFAALCASHADVQLWIIGDSAERAQLEQRFRQLGVAGKVTFYGAQYGQQKLDLLKKSDLFVHPSRNEGLPTAVLEAAAMGLPSIVTTATNMGEAIAEYDGGWVIPDTNTQQLLEAWEKACQIWKQGKLKEYGQRGRHMVNEAFHWNNILQRIDKMYDTCLH